MNTNHTPAPWTYDKLQDLCKFNIFASGFNTAMCQVTVMESSTRRVTGSEVEANARLIAAAPELLEALNAIVKRAEDPALCDDTDTLLRNARTAIAKATGEQPCTTN
jgi:hypothetical protein